MFMLHTSVNFFFVETLALRGQRSCRRAPGVGVIGLACALVLARRREANIAIGVASNDLHEAQASRIRNAGDITYDSEHSHLVKVHRYALVPTHDWDKAFFICFVTQSNT